MPINTTEPKMRDAYGSLIDNPNYIRPIVAGVNDRAGITNAAQDPAIKNAYNNGVNAYGERLPGFTANDAYKDIALPSNTDSAELIAAREQKASMDRTAGNQAYDEATIRRDALANFQAEIDATNALYAGKLSRAKVEGANRLGQSGAIQARRGLLGSTFGEAQTNVVSGANEEVYGSIENERNTKVLALQDKAREYADTSLESKRKAKTEGLDAYIKYLSEEGGRKTANAKTVAAALIAAQSTPDQVNPDVLQETAKNYGITTDAIKAAYTEMKAAKDAADKAAALKDAYSLKPGETRYDATGKVLSALPTTPKTEAELALDKAELAYKNSQTALNYANVEKAREDAKKARKELKAGEISPYQAERSFRTIQSVDTLMDQVNSMNTGFGSWLAGIPTSEARNFKAQVDTLKSSIAFSELTAMREASKTGGALGNVSNIELGLLESALGSLDTGLSPTQFKTQLEKIRNSVTRWSNAVNASAGDISTMTDAELEAIANQ